MMRIRPLNQILTGDSGTEEPDAPPLTRRVWLLVPLVVVSIVGLVTPYVAEDRTRSAGPSAEDRIDYRDELLPLLADSTLSERELEALRDTHARFQQEMRDHGGIRKHELKNALKLARPR